MANLVECRQGPRLLHIKTLEDIQLITEIQHIKNATAVNHTNPLPDHGTSSTRQVHIKEDLQNKGIHLEGNPRESSCNQKGMRISENKILKNDSHIL
jgi:hypothetical protein